MSFMILAFSLILKIANFNRRNLNIYKLLVSLLMAAAPGDVTGVSCAGCEAGGGLMQTPRRAPVPRDR